MVVDLGVKSLLIVAVVAADFVVVVVVAAVVDFDIEPFVVELEPGGLARRYVVVSFHHFAMD
jgi:hypothetical protein